MITAEEFRQILDLGHGREGIEFKAAGPRTDPHLFARVVKAVLGMANHSDGGLVVLGVKEDESAVIPTGLNEADLVTWNHDDVASGLATFTDPSVNFELQTLEYEGKTFVILHVREFEEVPILCNKDFTPSSGAILRKGACYVRSRRKPETTEIPNHEDMRALLKLATTKALRGWIAQAQTAGVLSPGSRPVPTDQESFDTQLGDLR